MESKTMKIVTWMIQVLLSLGLLMAGVMKLMTPYEELVKEMAWAEDFSATQIMIIGALEILGVIGLNLPFLLKKFKKLVPIASAGLAMIMIGAIFTHIERGESFVPPLVLFAMALFVTYSRKHLIEGVN